MAVRKRTWTTRAGEAKKAWVVDYVDQHGRRHIKTFQQKKRADAYANQTGVDVRMGVHTAESASITVAEAAANWVKAIELRGREPATLAQYRSHANVHIVPQLGGVKLAKLTRSRVLAFTEQLLEDGMTHVTARKVLTSLKSILSDAQDRAHVAQNVALSVRIKGDHRGRRRLQVGKDIPATDEIRRLLAAAGDGLRPLVMTAVFTGLRASELRGLRWADVDLVAGTITVRQRADRYNTIGLPKSRAGAGRVIPLAPQVVNTLKTWRLACPPNDGDLVFPVAGGGVPHYNRIGRALNALMTEAGLVDAGGKPKYAWHSLRHFYASWCINRKADGGLELPAKIVQARLGHASIVMTLDTYGHLFPSEDDGAELAAAAQRLLV
jgi:integrase